MIQERESCHQNLKAELGCNQTIRPKLHQFKADSFVCLRACWRKGLDNFSNSTHNNETLHSLHSPHNVLNPNLKNIVAIEEDRVDKFVCVKITQPNGWFLENSKFPEVLTIPQAMTPRQQKSALNHASQQIEVMSGLLVQSTGMQVTMSDSCEPVQFLKKDGKSLHFAKKSDLTSWLFKQHETAFVNESDLIKDTDSLNSVTCMIRDCMFDFPHLKIPTCTYKEMCSLIIDQTVKHILLKYVNKDRHFTFIQKFDHRADQTKGCTEATRASVPVSPLEYTCLLFDKNEVIKAYNTRWQKIITSYVRSCADVSFLKSQNFPAHNFTYIVVGGNSGILSAYSGAEC